MDKYTIEAAGSSIENNPMFRVVFKRPIDPIRLEAAVNKALESYPLFKTSVEFDHEYYLETNNRPLKILCVREEDRPNNFGATTNGYPWRITYFEKTMCFEWLHGVTDGVGSATFLKDLLMCYFDLEPTKKSHNFLIATGLEPFYDAKEKGINYKIDPPGFSIKDYPKIKQGFKAQCHKLTCSTKELVDVAHTCNSSVAPLLAVLFSRAIRRRLPDTAKNRNVACNMAFDLRRSLNYESMHNCSEVKRYTYTDEHDNMNIKSAAAAYKAKLDNARLAPNIVRAVTERIKLFKSYHIIPRRWWVKFIAKLIGIFMKDTDCNFVLTYVGRIDLPSEVMDKLENVDLKVWHDFGQCMIPAIDFGGKFNLNIHESYVDKGIVDDFIELSRSIGIHWTNLGEEEFIQSHFIDK